MIVAKRYTFDDKPIYTQLVVDILRHLQHDFPPIIIAGQAAGTDDTMPTDLMDVSLPLSMIRESLPLAKLHGMMPLLPNHSRSNSRAV